MTALVAALVLTAGTVGPFVDFPATGFLVEKTRQGISLRGHVASDRARDELLAYADEAQIPIAQFESNRHIVLPDWWRAAMKRLLPLANALHSGDVLLTRTELAVRGAAAAGEPVADRLAQVRKVLPAGFVVSERITRIPIGRDEPICETLFSSLQKDALLFRRKSTAVKSEDHARLNRLAATLRRCPTIHIRITGHSDAFGTAARNQAVSEQRARGVADYLERLGVPTAQLTWQGRGDRDPAATNDTWEGRNLNRRVEIDRRN